jgi:2-polyprenyl-6-methoxyphenol hydroxylase-like FAD-dependent oxidoreductase
VSAVTPLREDFDVAISGAGFAGLACARSVALRGRLFSPGWKPNIAELAA